MRNNKVDSNVIKLTPSMTSRMNVAAGLENSKKSDGYNKIIGNTFPRWNNFTSLQGPLILVHMGHFSI